METDLSDCKHCANCEAMQHDGYPVCAQYAKSSLKYWTPHSIEASGKYLMRTIFKQDQRDNIK